MTAGPLAGYRVIELGQGIPAAFAAMQLGDGGADVIKVEPTGGEIGRQMPPFLPNGASAVFVAINRNKRAVSLELEAAPGRRVLARLIAGNEALVHCRITGYGPEGPWADLPGAEIAAQMAAEATTSLGSLKEP